MGYGHHTFALVVFFSEFSVLRNGESIRTPWRNRERSEGSGVMARCHLFLHPAKHVE